MDELKITLMMHGDLQNCTVIHLLNGSLVNRHPPPANNLL